MSTRLLVSGFLLAASLAAQATDTKPQEPTTLRPGATVKGKVTAADPTVHTRQLDRHYEDAAVRGKAYTLEIDQRSRVAIELRSYLFDAYLVVRKEDGRLLPEDGSVLAEDDNGLLGTHALIAGRLAPGRYRVLACALNGGVGRFPKSPHRSPECREGPCSGYPPRPSCLVNPRSGEVGEPGRV